MPMVFRFTYSPLGLDYRGIVQIVLYFNRDYEVVYPVYHMPGRGALYRL